MDAILWEASSFPGWWTLAAAYTQIAATPPTAQPVPLQRPRPHMSPSASRSVLCRPVLALAGGEFATELAPNSPERRKNPDSRPGSELPFLVF